ncbi:MAG: hypothetical protein IMW89_22715 [Ktedonobacteraceae bacterium]|nr:hypothetical protein [Ktedonobacteraceae bacterium]
MRDIAPEVVSMAEACLGGLQGRSALLIGPREQRSFYMPLLQRAQMKHIYEEDTPERLPHLLPYVQLLISMPDSGTTPEFLNMRTTSGKTAPRLTAASIAKGCVGRRSPLLIFDLAIPPSVEELAGLLPAVCLYTPADLHNILSRASRSQARAS